MIRELFSILIVCTIILAGLIFRIELMKIYKSSKEKYSSSKNSMKIGTDLEEQAKKQIPKLVKFMHVIVDWVSELKNDIIENKDHVRKELLDFIVTNLITLLLLSSIVFVISTDLYTLFQYGEYKINKTKSPVEYDVIRWTLVFILFSIIMLLKHNRFSKDKSPGNISKNGK